MPTSKSFQRFDSRYSILQQHSQIITVSLNKTFNFLRTKKDNGKSICENLDINNADYSKLNVPSSEYARIVNYSKRENSDHCFTELYNLFSYYMKDILKEMYALKPKSITTKSNKTLTFSKLSEFLKIEDLVDYMINEIFREFENLRSTPKLVKRIIAHTKIQIPQALSENAMMYLNIRHLIIHNNSKIDQEYFDKYKNKLSISLNGKVPTDFSNFQQALVTVYDYLKVIDGELIAKGFMESR